MHFECGFIDSSDSGPDGITCLLCYYKFGRTLKGPSDPEFRPRSEKDPSDAAEKKAAKKKDRASRPKTGANDVNDEDQSSSAESTVGTTSEPDHSTQDPPLFPAANTRAARPSPYRSAKPKKLSSSRSPSAKRKEKEDESNDKIDENNPDYMYPEYLSPVVEKLWFIDENLNIGPACRAMSL